MYGYTLEELKRLPLGIFGAGESVEERRRRLIDQYRQVVKGSSRTFQLEATKKDGSTFWVEMNVRRITIGGRKCLLTVSQDVTQLRNAQEARKRSEEAALLLAQETGVIAEIGRIISSSLDIEEVYERFAEEVHKLIPFDRILVNLVNRHDGTLLTAYTAGMEVAGRRKGACRPDHGVRHRADAASRERRYSFSRCPLRRCRIDSLASFSLFKRACVRGSRCL